MCLAPGLRVPRVSTQVGESVVGNLNLTTHLILFRDARVLSYSLFTWAFAVVWSACVTPVAQSVDLRVRSPIRVRLATRANCEKTVLTRKYPFRHLTSVGENLTSVAAQMRPKKQATRCRVVFVFRTLTGQSLTAPSTTASSSSSTGLACSSIHHSARPPDVRTATPSARSGTRVSSDPARRGSHRNRYFLAGLERQHVSFGGRRRRPRPRRPHRSTARGDRARGNRRQRLERPLPALRK
jgi:hypothetical protein